MYLQNIDQALVVQKLASGIHWINLYPVDLVSIRETNCTIHWIEIYLVLVVQTLDSSIHRINHYPGDSVIDFCNTNLLDSD